MQRYPQYTRERLKKFSGRIRELIYQQRCPATSLSVSGPVDRIRRQAAEKLVYRPAKLGEHFGPPWATFWFQVEAQVPRQWAGARVDLLWNSHSEATLWKGERTIQGLNFHMGDRPDAILLPKAQGGETLRFQIEMACNGKFGVTMTCDDFRQGDYFLEQCEIAVFDALAWELYYDFRILQELQAEIVRGGGPMEQAWGGKLLAELNRFVNAIDLTDRTTWPPAQALLKALYQHHNASLVHQVSAIGHAHIDTAWLWPLAETERKCERTFSSQIAYMDQYPEYKFACSQACQYDIIKRRNPDLYERIRAKVKAGQFVPVGGTWVEPDCNLPSGEALVRQFLYGQRFFQKEFGLTCGEFWQPDVFGYNGQLPQIMRLCGIRHFLTQKLSWNQFNKPLYHTFLWQGLDGSEVLAHFPPADTYNSMADVPELRRIARDYKDHDRSRHSLMLFGFGDGGGGPTKEMIETIRRARDLQGLPPTTVRSSAEFFALLEQDYRDPVRQIGELYFELHRGTYTTQAATKKANRKAEWLLHDVEFLAATAARKGALKYPRLELERLWKILLLNQFHDILPGSSIGLVYEDNKRQMEELAAEGGALREQALRAAFSGGGPGAAGPVNTIGFARHEVAPAPDGSLVYVEAPCYGVGRFVAAPDQVRVSSGSGRFILENGRLRAELSVAGTLTSLVEKTTGREALSGPGNQLLLYRDEPNNFDAWDLDPQDLETEAPCPPASSAKIVQADALRGAVEFERRLGRASKLIQVVSLSANAPRLEFSTRVDWREEKKHLKVAFPVNVRALSAAYEMQFGNAQRPTHYNTPYDLARFEVPGHKWADLSEHGFGVALLSESKYGFSTFGQTMRISLLRATTSPDPHADIGGHEFAYAIMPHPGTWHEADVVAEAARFNSPILFVPAAGEPRSVAWVDDGNLVLDTIKQAEDDDAVILRLYECHGARGTAKLHVDLPFQAACFCDLLEQPGAAVKATAGALEIPYRPYQIISLKLA